MKGDWLSIGSVWGLDFWDALKLVTVIENRSSTPYAGWRFDKGDNRSLASGSFRNKLNDIIFGDLQAAIAEPRLFNLHCCSLVYLVPVDESFLTYRVESRAAREVT